MTTHPSVSPPASVAIASRTPALMLALATAGFAVNFWAWALLSPLASGLKDTLHLTSFQQALIVAVPVIVGALGRIPVGALTDRLGGRVMFPAVSFATILPVLYLGLVGHKSFAGLIVGGFFLGIAGTAFAVGVPMVSGWFAAARRGTAIGIFGAGMGGTAISALTTVKLSTRTASRRRSCSPQSCSRRTASLPCCCCVTRPTAPCRRTSWPFASALLCACRSPGRPPRSTQ